MLLTDLHSMKTADPVPVISPLRKRKLRVAFVIKAFVRRAGGAEKVLCNAANCLASAGFDVTIYHGDAPGASFFPLRPEIHLISIRPKHKSRWQGTSNEPKGRPKGLKYVKYLFPLNVGLWLHQHLWFVRAIRRFADAHKPDLVIAFQPNATTDTLVALTGTGIPVVASLHNVPEQDFSKWERWDANPFDRFLRKFMLRRAKRITILLEEFANWFPTGLRKRLFTLPNAIEVSGDLANVRDNIKRSEKIVIVVGRLAPAKDHATLIRAWASIQKKYPDWQVRIYGDGPLRSSLQSLIRECQVNDSLHLMGASTEIMAAYEKASIFCMPSIFEGFGLVTAEALAKGLPSIGFVDCPGTNSLILDGTNGLLVDPGMHEGDRTKALATGLVRLIEDPELCIRLAEHAPASVAKYAPEAIAKLWVELAQSCIPMSKLDSLQNVPSTSMGDTHVF
jgi:glycosyltransferase involved in cell wall biosynthesis